MITVLELEAQQLCATYTSVCLMCEDRRGDVSMMAKAGKGKKDENEEKKKDKVAPGLLQHT